MSDIITVSVVAFMQSLDGLPQCKVAPPLMVISGGVILVWSRQRVVRSQDVKNVLDDDRYGCGLSTSAYLNAQRCDVQRP